MAHQVFISYSNKDKQMANAVCHYLEQEKIRCWMAPRDIRLGADFAGEIANAIPKSKVLLIILSSSSNSSKQVLRELELAINNDLIVIPIRIEDIIPTGGMSYYLSTMQWIDIIDKEIDSKLSLLTNRIKNILGIVEQEEEIQIEKEKPITYKQSEETNGAKRKPSLKKKISTKNLILILSSMALIAIIGITLALLRDTIFGGEKELISASSSETQMSEPAITETSTTEEGASEDSDYDLNMPVDIPDPVLLDCVYVTLDIMGEWPEDGVLTVEDMLKLRNLVLTTPHAEEVEALVMVKERTSIEKYKYISDNPIESLQGLEYAKNLDCLVVTERNLDDIQALKGLSNLKILYLGSNNIYDLSPLSELRSLGFLNLEYNQFANLHRIENLSNLMVLDLTGCENIPDFSSIARLINLEFLNISHTHFENLPILQHMDNLLDLRLNDVGIKDYSTLGQLPYQENIENLQLSGNNIRDISFLSNFSGLMGLNIDQTLIEDISTLSELTNLTHLGMLENNISDISPLADLVNLQVLEIDADTYNNNLETVNKLIANGCSINPD